MTSEAAAPPRRSREEIYQDIELARPFCSGQQFQALLDRDGSDWAACLDYFKPKNSASRAKVESGEFDFEGSRARLGKSEKAFVIRLSDDLGLDELQSYAALRGCLRERLRSSSVTAPAVAAGTAAATKDPTPVLSIAYDDDLLDAVCAFHFDDRCAALRLMDAVLRASANPAHPFAAELTAYVAGLARAGFAATVLAQAARALAARVPPRAETSPRRAAACARQALQEQKLLLTVLFVAHYDAMPSRPADCAAIATALAPSRFGWVQPNSPLFDADCRDLWRDVCFLCVLVFVAALNLELLLDDRGDRQNGDGTPAAPPDPKDVDAIRRSLLPFLELSAVSGDSHIGLLLLAAGAFFQKLSDLDPARFAPGASAPFVSRAFDLGCLRYAASSLEHLSLDPDDPNALAQKSVVRGVLTLCLELFSVADETLFGEFLAGFAVVFADAPELCHQFWIQDYPVAERRAVLDLARARFPAASGDLPRILFALAADATTAAYVFRYAARLPTATVLAPDHALTVDRSGALRLGSTVGISPVRGRRFRADVTAGCLASRIADAGALPFLPAGTSVAIVQVDCAFSLFHLLAALADAYSELEHSSGASAAALNYISEPLSCLLALFNRLLQLGDLDLKARIVDHVCEAATEPAGRSAVVALIARVLSNTLAVRNAESRLIGTCIESLTLLLPLCPDDVWNFLRHEPLLPRATPTSGRFMAPGDRVLQQSIFPVERSRGSYETTIAILELIEALVHQLLERGPRPSSFGEDADVDLLVSSILFFLTEVFPAYGSWRYKQVVQKYDIGCRILGICNSVMTDTTLATGRLRSASTALPTLRLHELVTNTFLDGSLFLVAPLLDIASTGVASLARLYRARKMKEASHLESSLSAALGLLRSLLAWRKASGLTGTVLEHAMMDRTVAADDAAPAETELIQVLGSYVSYEFSVDIPTLSLELLALLCAVSADWRPRPPAFVGYFEDPDTGRPAEFIRRVIDIAGEDPADAGDAGDDDDARARESRQSLAVTLVAAIFQTQTALAGSFLDVKSDAPGSSAIKSLLLQRVRRTIANWRAVPGERSTVLLATLQLVEAMWRMRREYQSSLDTLASDSSFWADLLDLAAVATTSDLGSPGAPESLCCRVVFDIFLHEILHLRNVRVGSTSIIPKHVEPFLRALLNDHLPTLARDAVLTTPPGPERALASDLLAPYARVLWSDTLDPMRFQSRHDVRLYAERLGRSLSPSTSLSSSSIGRPSPAEMEAWDATAQARELRLASLRSLCLALEMAATKFGHSMWESLAPAGALAALLDASDLLLDLLTGLGAENGNNPDVCVRLASCLARSLGAAARCAADAAAHLTPTVGGHVVSVLERTLAAITALSSRPRTQAVLALQTSLHLSATGLLRAVPTLLASGKAVVKDTVGKLFRCSSAALLAVLAGLRRYCLDSFQADEYLATAVVLVDRLLWAARSASQPTYAADWRDLLDRNGVPGTLLQLFAIAFAAAAVSDDAAELAVAELALQCLHHLAADPDTAALLAAAGLVAAFATCPLAPLLADGALPPYLHHERARPHEIWCRMLLLLADALRNHPAPAPAFASAAAGLLALFAPQLQRAAAALASAAPPATGGPGAAIDPLAPAVLQELEAHARAAHGLATACVRLGPGDLLTSPLGPFLADFFATHLELLRAAVYDLRHPARLAAKATAVSREERDAAARDQGATARTVEGLLLDICRNETAVLLLTHGTEHALLRHPPPALTRIDPPAIASPDLLLDLLQAVQDRLPPRNSAASSTAASAPPLSDLCLTLAQALAVYAGLRVSPVHPSTSAAASMASGGSSSTAAAAAASDSAASATDPGRDLLDALQQLRPAVDAAAAAAAAGGADLDGATAARAFLKDAANLEAFFSRRRAGAA